MNRISSLMIASTLAILPLSAFAQQTVAPAKTAEPAGMTTTAPATGKTAAATSAKTDMAKPEMGKSEMGKSEAKTAPSVAKTDVHGANNDAGHQHKTVPAPKS